MIYIIRICSGSCVSGATLFAKVIMTDLFNKSIANEAVPSQWKGAYIRPVPKVRPIMQTDPVMSRMMEKMVVRELSYLSLISPDSPPSQLTYLTINLRSAIGQLDLSLPRPHSSMLQTISNLLLSNEYVMTNLRTIQPNFPDNSDDRWREEAGDDDGIS